MPHGDTQTAVLTGRVGWALAALAGVTRGREGKGPGAQGRSQQQELRSRPWTAVTDVPDRNGWPSPTFRALGRGSQAIYEVTEDQAHEIALYLESVRLS